MEEDRLSEQSGSADTKSRLSPTVETRNQHFRILYERRRQVAIRIDDRRRQAATFPFLRLPPELRRQIYTYIIGSQNMTVLLKPRSWHTKVIRNSGKRAFNFPLTYSTVSCRQELAHIQTGFANEPLGTGINVYPLPRYCRVCGLCRPVSGPRIGKVNILYLCKQTSQEFSEELYGNITFVINSYYTLGAFLRSIGKINGEKIKKIVVYYARMSRERAGLLGDWLGEAWASLKGSSVIQTMTRLQSLRVVNVVGAGKILPSTLPWRPGLRPALIWTDEAARKGGWAGMATDVWRDGKRHRHSLFPALDAFSKIKIGRIEIEIDDGWLTDITGSMRSRLDQRLQLTDEMKEQHMQNIRERVTWKDPEDVEEEELKQAVIKWNSKG